MDREVRQVLLPTGPVVLVVDRDLASLEASRRLLDGYRVLCAQSPDEALDLLRVHRPDAVLLDASFDEDTRAAVMRGLRGQDPIAAPTLVVSSSQDDDLLTRSFEEGAADFLTKPLNGRALSARLERSIREVAARRVLTERAETDALTGLPNFRALSARLSQEFTRARRYRYPVAAVMIDLDRLKRLNDRFGHDAGNRAIRRVADHLRENLRQADFAARYGGDEFIVLLPHQTAREAHYFAQRIGAVGTLRVRSAAGSSMDLKLTLSVGVAASEPEHLVGTPDQLLQAADAALCEAKRRGRNRVVTWDLPPSDSAPTSSQGPH